LIVLNSEAEIEMFLRLYSEVAEQSNAYLSSYIDLLVQGYAMESLKVQDGPSPDGKRKYKEK
jgi:hypothetical protein